VIFASTSTTRVPAYARRNSSADALSPAARARSRSTRGSVKTCTSAKARASARCGSAKARASTRAARPRGVCAARPPSAAATTTAARNSQRGLAGGGAADAWGRAWPRAPFQVPKAAFSVRASACEARQALNAAL